MHNHQQDGASSEGAAMCRPLSNSQRIRKVVFELIETERQYVRVCLNL